MNYDYNRIHNLPSTFKGIKIKLNTNNNNNTNNNKLTTISYKDFKEKDNVQKLVNSFRQGLQIKKLANNPKFKTSKNTRMYIYNICNYCSY